MQGLIATGAEWWPVIVASLLALLFLGLWLSARAGGGSAEHSKQLKAAQNEVRLLRGDAIQARREIDLSNGRVGGDGMATTGFILGIIDVALFFILIAIVAQA